MCKGWKFSPKKFLYKKIPKFKMFHPLTLSSLSLSFINYQFSPSRSLNSDAIQSIKNAYLSEEEDYNLIGVDWSEMAADNNYLRSAGSTRDVGRNIANVINYMVTEHNAKLKDFHVIGMKKEKSFSINLN